MRPRTYLYSVEYILYYDGQKRYYRERFSSEVFSDVSSVYDITVFMLTGSACLKKVHPHQWYWNSCWCFQQYFHFRCRLMPIRMCIFHKEFLLRSAPQTVVFDNVGSYSQASAVARSLVLWAHPAKRAADQVCRICSDVCSLSPHSQRDVSAFPFD
jgi:hypothetical protein